MSKDRPDDEALQQRISDFARRHGRSENDVMREAMEEYLDRHRSRSSSNGAKTPYEVAKERGLIGCLEGPGDLSTNPKYFEGFGRE
jgi:predicted metal-dependent peptidase